MIQKQKKQIKKSFYEIEAPATSTKIHLYASSPEELEGKIAKIDLTRSLKGKSFELKLRIKIDDKKIHAEPESLALVNSYVRKVMRHGTDYCEDSFTAECRDNIVRIKPFLITRKRVSRAVLKVLRETAKKYIAAYIKTRTANELFSDIISNKLQKQLVPHLKKVYPLALCEIRVFQIINQKKIEKKESEKQA